MNQKANPPDQSLPVSELIEVHKVCQQFEAEWKAGRQTKAADFLGDTPEPKRSELKRELEAIEAEYRQKSKKPTLDVFIETLAGSGLMTRADVQNFLTTLPADKRPADAERLAREMFKQGKLTKFQAQAIYQGKTRGLVVGNYVVLDKLGQGGMGQVYKAQHRKMKRIVAIKMLPSSATKSPDAVKRFQREVEAAAKLSHPNIVTAHDADEANGVNFLVMEHVDGQDLSALVKGRGPLSLAQAVDCAVQAAKGLEYAHRQGVVHRDIKPSNLLLDKGGTVKILDMGLARIEDAVGGADDGLTHSGQVMGTLDYMAPEQAFDTHHADARSDIYSLGCTLHYLLVGRAPFAGDSMTQKILAHREQPVPSLRVLRPDVPEWLDGVFQKMLAKRPEERQQTMGEVMTQLQQQALPQTEPVVSLRPGPASVAETLSLRQGKVETSSEKVEVGSLLPPGEGQGEGDEDALAFLAAPAGKGPGRKAPPRPRRTKALGVSFLRRFTTRQKIGAAVATGMLFVLVLLGVIFKLRTKEGTLVVEIDDPNVTVQVLDGEGKIQIERPGEKDKLSIAVDPGKHRLRIEKNGIEVFTKDFAMASRGTETIKASWEPSAASPDAQSSARLPAVGNLIGADGKWKLPPGAPPPAVAPFDAANAKEHQAAWAKYLGVPVEITNSIGMKLVLIPPGEFDMGSPPELIDEELKAAKDDKLYLEYLPSEGPRHHVRITRPFYLGIYLVTQEEYQRVMGASPSVFSATGNGKGMVAGQDTKRLPVENVSWQDTDEFCSRLSEMREEKSAGRRYRLPSEAQWEYACRAGSKGRYFFSPVSDDKKAAENLLSEYAWFGNNAGGRPHSVGGRRASPWGLYDMYGNVAEWCQDWYDKEYYASSPVDDPAGPSGGSDRVIRGGFWFSPAGYCRSAYRFICQPGSRYGHLGFRVCLVVPDTAAERAKMIAALDTAQLSGSATANKPSPAGPDVQPLVRLPAIGSLIGPDGKWKLPPGAPAPAIAPFDAKKAKEHQEAWAKNLGVPVEITNSIGMKLVLIPAGEFEMGSPKELIVEELKTTPKAYWRYRDHLPSEGPRHHVRITRPFYLGMYLVTQEEYQRVMGASPSEFSATGKSKNKVAGQDTKRFPVETVSWSDTDEFCSRLSETPEEKSAGRRYRLPSEAQWEYACRAGSTGRCFFSPVSDDKKATENLLPEYAWFWNNARGPHAVGGRRASPWGLYDMYGNATEWCQDWYAQDYYAKSPADDPAGPPGGSERVSRGGGWSQSAWDCRSADRIGLEPGNRNNFLGFRVALVVPDTAAERAKMIAALDTAQLSGSATANKPSPAGPDVQPLVRLPAIGSLIGPDGKWKLRPGAPAPAVAPFDEKKAKEHQQAWAKHLGVPVVQANSIGMKLVLIPPGEFEMGSPPELIVEQLKVAKGDTWGLEHLPSEGPRHHVRITRPFYLGMYPVTQEEYQRVIGANPSEFSATGKGKDRAAGQDTKRFPVENVSWQDTDDFCSRLSEMREEKSAGRRYRLPSEAQWEYACRAGSTGRYFFSPVSDDKKAAENLLSEYAWFGNNAGGRPHAVGGRRASPWGLYDMYGNVAVWCQDWYAKDYYAKSPPDDPAGPPGGSNRVHRGGYWFSPAGYCRSARHLSDGPWLHACSLGFRVSLVLADTAGRRKTVPSAESSVPSPQAPAPIPNPQSPAPAIAPFDEKKAKEHQEGWAKHLGAPVELTNSIGMKLVLIPPGEFTMGSPKEVVKEELQRHGGDSWYRRRLPGEVPQHHVRITKAFWFAVTPVTQEEYQRVMGFNPSKFRDDPKRPAEQVSWNEATEFCRKLSELPAEKAARRRYQLPTEAQWEYACRAGSTTRFWFGDDERLLGEYGWFSGNSGGQTHLVGQKKPNAWGLYDVCGNVWQWCADWHDENYYKVSPESDPTGPISGARRVQHGGSWHDDAGYCRSADRNDDGGNGDSFGHMGLRASLVLPDTAAERAKMSRATDTAQPSDGSTANKPLRAVTSPDTQSPGPNRRQTLTANWRDSSRGLGLKFKVTNGHKMYSL